MNNKKDFTLISDPNSSAQIFRAVSAVKDEIWTVKTKNRQLHFKFCAICGHMLRNVSKTLTDHYAAQHKNING